MRADGAWRPHPGTRTGCPAGRSRTDRNRQPGYRSTFSGRFSRRRAPEGLAEVERVADHVELSLKELVQRTDDEIGRAAADVEEGRQGAEGRLAMAEDRHGELLARRQRRREELQQQQALSRQGVERMTSVLVLPHPDRGTAEVKRHQPDRRRKGRPCASSWTTNALNVDASRT